MPPSHSDNSLSKLIIDGFIDVKQDIADVRERLAVVETKIDERAVHVDKRSSRYAKAWGVGAATAIGGVVEVLHKIGWLK